MSLRPTARHIGEHRQDRQFVVVIPKNERIVPEQNEAEEDDDQPRRCRTENLRTRGTRSGHPRKENAERSTSNVQRPTRKPAASSRVLFRRSDTGEENPNEFFGLTENRRRFRRRYDRRFARES
jgi:hypothetical protein